MSYVKTNWVNDQAPAINATNLNKIEQGIYDNDGNISGINETLGVDTNTWVGTTAYGEGDIVIYNDKIYQNISGTSTTTNPAEDTTNWDETSIFDTDSINDDLIDKTKFIKNTHTNSGVNTYGCNYLNDKVDGIVLFTNTSGSTSGNLTLNEDISHFSKIDIEVISKAGVITNETIYNPSGKTIEVKTGNGDNGTQYYIYSSCRLTFSGTTATRSQDRLVVLGNGVLPEVSNGTTYYTCGITKIIGYK